MPDRIEARITVAEQYIQEKRKVSDFLCVLSYVCLHKMKPCEKERDQLKKNSADFPSVDIQVDGNVTDTRLYISGVLDLCVKSGQHHSTHYCFIYVSSADASSQQKLRHTC